MSHITPFGWYWLIWGFLGFGLPEAYGLIYNVKDTLSDQVWGLEHINFGHPFDFADWTWLHYLIGCMLLIGFTWLLGHLVWGIWR
jgi:hypothetical protein